MRVKMFQQSIRWIIGLLVIILTTSCGQMITDEGQTAIPKAKEKKTEQQSPNTDNKTKSEQAKETNSKETKSKVETSPAQEKESASGSGEDTLTENRSLEEVDKVIKQMTLEEKVGQMFMARVPETMQIEKLKQYHLGAYLLFARDFKDKNKAEVLAMTRSYQQNSKLPLWIAVDEEGGVVNRVSRNPELRLTPFGSPQTLYKNGGFERIHSDTKQKAELLLSLGINLNMAPVVDVPEKESDFIYTRALSTDAALVSQYTEQMIKDMNELGIASVLKHFPGYGANIDTHTEFAVDNRDVQALKERDLLPFIAGIRSGADAILVSHNVIAKLDSQMPASLSEKVHQLLRKNLKFKGVILTDDLRMDAVNKLLPEGEAAVQAVLAGNDMLCSTSFEVQIPAVIQAVRDGKISEKQIDESVKRILLWKQKFLHKE